jgi:hypothetical protein
MAIARLWGLVVTLFVVMSGCASSYEATSTSSQDVTQCQLDCPGVGAPVFTCTTLPCSVTANTLTCNGATSVCPAPTCLTCQSAGAQCGTISNACGGTLSCGSCPSGQTCVGNTCEVVCPSGLDDCCDDGVCRSLRVCQVRGCL